MPIILALKEMISENGDRILNITYQMYRFNRKDEDFSTTSIHAIDTVKNIVGSDYKSVEFHYQPLTDFGEHVKNIYMSCEFEDSVVAQISLVPMGGDGLRKGNGKYNS